MRVRVFVLLIAVALILPTAASDAKDDEPKTDLQKMRKTLEEVNAQVLNAGTKLRLGAKAVDSGGAMPGETPPTPARICCGSNIDKIAKHFSALATSARSLLACYQARGQADHEVSLNFFRQDASAVYGAMEEFTAARQDDEVAAGYAKVAQAVLDMRKSAKELAECEPPGTP